MLAVTEQKVRLTGMRIDVSAEHGGVRAGLAEAGQRGAAGAGPAGNCHLL